MPWMGVTVASVELERCRLSVGKFLLLRDLVPAWCGASLCNEAAPAIALIGIAYSPPGRTTTIFNDADTAARVLAPLLPWRNTIYAVPYLIATALGGDAIPPSKCSGTDTIMNS
jgi:hypothetical protein